MALPNRRSVMTLYSSGNDSHSHRVRLVVAEKGIIADILPVNPHNLPEDLLHLNPYGSLPTLVDRDLVLYESRIMMEYLDERFPHPPLLPVYPVARAKSRLMIYRIEKDWYGLLEQAESGTKAESANAAQQLRDSLVGLDSVFGEKPYFLSDEFTLVDCALAPLLWRLKGVGITIPEKATHLTAYMERIFERPSFQASLSEDERDMVLLEPVE